MRCCGWSFHDRFAQEEMVDIDEEVEAPTLGMILWYDWNVQ